MYFKGTRVKPETEVLATRVPGLGPRLFSLGESQQGKTQG